MIAAVITGIVLPLVMTVLGGLFYEEVKGRLDRFCFALLRAAAKRLAGEDGQDLYENDLYPQLYWILREWEGTPITRLFYGVRFSVRIWSDASRVSGELNGARRGPRQVLSDFWNSPSEGTIGDMVASSAVFYAYATIFLMPLHGTLRSIAVIAFLPYGLVVAWSRQRWGKPYGRDGASRHATHIEFLVSFYVVWPMIIVCSAYIAVNNIITLVAGHSSAFMWVGLAFAFFLVAPSPLAIRMMVRAARKLPDVEE